MYNSKRYIQTLSEDTNFSIRLIVGLVMATVMMLIRIIFTKAMVSSAKENPSLSKKIAAIVNDDVEVMQLDIPEPNAFNAGTKKLYYTPELKKMLTEDELVAVLLHEYAHYKGYHMWKYHGLQFISSTFLTIAISYIGTDNLAIKMFLRILVMLGVNIAVNRTFGRNWENTSDSYSAKMGYGKPMSSALKKLNLYLRKKLCEQKSKQECDRMMSSLHALDAHPEIEDRLENILNSSDVKKLITVNNSKFSSMIKRIVGVLN